MFNFEVVMNEIEKKKITIITTKELKEFGFSNYYIQKAIDMGRLLRSERGQYTVIKTQDRNAIFTEFCDNVFKNKFDEAYYNLIRNVNLQVDHMYDSHLYIYGILLKEILKDKNYDFAFIDDLWYFSKISQIGEGDYIYYEKFEEAVMQFKFNEALSYINTYKKLQTSKHVNKISTKLFSHLISAVVYQKRNEQKLQQQIIESKERQMIWRKFYNNIKYNNYKEAIEDLNTIMTFGNNVNIPKWISILNTCIDMEENHKIIAEKKEDYSNLDDLQKLYQAIEKEDYLAAWRFCLICIQQNPISNNLKKYRDLLQKVILLNTKIIKEKEEQEKEKIKEQEQKIKLEKKKKAKISDIQELIYNREYEKVQEFLEDHFQDMPDSRMYAYILKLIKELNQIQNLRLPRRNSAYQYTTAQSDIFKHFFEALRLHDYEEAYQYATLCEERNNKIKKGDIEFTMYRSILEDILKALEISEKQLEAQQQLQSFSEKLNNIIYNFNMREQLESLKELLQVKAEWNTDEQIGMYEAYALDIIDTIETVKENRLDESYFETYNNQSKQLLARFLESIQNGDYVTAYQIVTNPEWMYQTKTTENKKYFILFKKLLTILNDELKQQSVLVLASEVDEPNQSANNLGELYQLIKKYQYTEAYFMSQEMSSEMSESLKLILDTYLPLLQSILKQQVQSYVEPYEKGMKRGDFDIAEESLTKYQELIEKIGLNHELDHYFAKIESMRKEINTDGFVQKEQLYDYGLYYFEQYEYEKCIETMNQYIALDHDISAKGYMLRAESYRIIGKMENAKKDYEKAISIVPDPTAFQKLGIINLQNGDYATSLSNFLEYEKRCPNQSIDNLTLISNSYRNLGDIENQKKYELRIKYLNNLELMKG